MSSATCHIPEGKIYKQRARRVVVLQREHTLFAASLSFRKRADNKENCYNKKAILLASLKMSTLARPSSVDNTTRSASKWLGASSSRDLLSSSVSVARHTSPSLQRTAESAASAEARPCPLLTGVLIEGIGEVVLFRLRLRHHFATFQHHKRPLCRRKKLVSPMALASCLVHSGRLILVGEDVLPRGRPQTALAWPRSFRDVSSGHPRIARRHGSAESEGPCACWRRFFCVLLIVTTDDCAQSED